MEVLYQLSQEGEAAILGGSWRVYGSSFGPMVGEMLDRAAVPATFAVEAVSRCRLAVIGVRAAVAVQPRRWQSLAVFGSDPVECL